MKIKANKAEPKSIRDKAKEAITGLQNCQIGVSRQVKRHKTDSKDVEGGRCMRGSDGTLSFSGRIIKERIMNEEYDWEFNVQRDAAEGPVVSVNRADVFQALNEMKTGKAPGPTEVSLDLIAANRGVGIQVMAEISQKVLHGFGMLAEWFLSSRGRVTSGAAAAMEQ